MKLRFDLQTVLLAGAGYLLFRELTKAPQKQPQRARAPEQPAAENEQTHLGELVSDETVQHLGDVLPLDLRQREVVR